MGRSVFIAALAGLLLLQFAGAEEKATMNCRLTHGPNGPPRNGKFIVCETVFVQQMMSGVAHDVSGKIDISICLEVLDTSGKVVESKPWVRHNREYSSPMLNFVWAFQLATKPDNEKAGMYTCRLHLHDHIADLKTHSDAAFDLVPADGLTVYGLRCGQDPKGQGYASACFAVGDAIHVHGLMANIVTENHRTKGRATLRVLDASGKPSGVKSFAIPLGHEYSLYEEVVPEGFSLSFPALEAGRFTAEVRVEDLISGQETTEYIPFLVCDVSSLTVPDSLRSASKPVDGAKKR